MASSSVCSFLGEVTTKAAAESASERKSVKERAREVHRRRRDLGIVSLGRRGVSVSVCVCVEGRRRKRVGVWILRVFER